MSGIVKYMTRGSEKSITQVTVVRETAASVYLRSSSGGERRASKLGTYDQYHGTWADAHAHLVREAESQVASARHALDRVKGKLGNIKGMKDPSVTP
jgi:hypothetical protein